MNKIFLLIFFILTETLFAKQIWKENPAYKGLNSDGVVKLNDFAKLAKTLSPTVVNIQVEVEFKSRGFGADPFFDDPMYRFFDQYFDAPRTFKNRGIGSGVIISEGGYILTNNHVIEGATQIKISLLDDETLYDAKVIGTDAKTDLALIKIETKKTLPIAYLGDSDKLEIGEWVVAIGNPFGLEHTVTAGIVSAKERKDVNPSNRGGYYNFIQTDASINPGNSGGPLFNIKGEIIGINTAINSSGQGIGFAIPINMAKKVISQILDYGKVKRTWLGVNIQKVSKELAESFGRDNTHGALVTHIIPDSPAAKANIQEGDIILTFDGQTIKTSNDLPWLVSMAGIGEKKEITLLRDGKEIKLTLIMSPLPDETTIAVKENKETNNDINSLGFSVKDLTKEELKQLKIPAGILINDIKKDSIIDNAGIIKGDIILRVNNTKITNINEFKSLISKLKNGDIVRFYIKRGVSNLFIAFRVY